MANNEQRLRGTINIALIVAIVALIIAFLGLFFPMGIERRVEQSAAIKELRNLVDQRVSEVDQKLTATTQQLANFTESQQAATNKLSQLDQKVAMLEQQIGQFRNDSSTYRAQVNDNIRYHTQQLTALEKAQRNSETRLAQAMDQVKAAIVQQINKELQPVINQVKNVDIPAYQTRTDANFLYLTQQITNLSDAQRNIHKRMQDYFARIDNRLSAVEQQARELSENFASYQTSQTRINDNMRYQTQQLTALGTSQRNVEARLAKAIDEAKVLTKQLEQQLTPFIAQAKNLRDNQTRTEENILYHTRQLSELRESQRKAEAHLAKAIDEAKVLTKQLEQQLTPFIAQAKNLRDNQTRTEENILYHTRQLSELRESQRKAETQFAKLVDQAKAVAQQLAQKMDDNLRAFGEKIASEQARTEENILFHTQKLTNLENNQKEQSTLLSKGLGDVRQQVTSLKEETSARLAEVSKGLKEEIGTHIAEVSKGLEGLREYMRTQLVEVDEKINTQLAEVKRELNTRLAEVNEKINTQLMKTNEEFTTQVGEVNDKLNVQLTEVNEKFNLVSQQLTDLKESTDGRFGKAEADLSAFNEQLANIRTDMNERNTEVDRNLQFLSQEVNNLKDLSANLRAHLGSIEEDLSALSQRIRNVSQEAEESARSRLTTLERDLDSFNRKVAELVGFQDSIKSQMAEIGRNLSVLTQRVDFATYSNAKSELGTLLSKTVESLNTFDRQIGRFEEFNEMAKSHFDRINTSLNTLSQQVASLAEFKEATKSHLARVEEGLSQVHQQLAGFNEFKEAARSRLAEVDGKLSSFMLSYERSLSERAPVTVPAPR